MEAKKGNQRPHNRFQPALILAILGGKSMLEKKQIYTAQEIAEFLISEGFPAEEIFILIPARKKMYVASVVGKLENGNFIIFLFSLNSEGNKERKKLFIIERNHSRLRIAIEFEYFH